MHAEALTRGNLSRRPVLPFRNVYDERGGCSARGLNEKSVALVEEAFKKVTSSTMIPKAVRHRDDSCRVKSLSKKKAVKGKGWFVSTVEARWRSLAGQSHLDPVVHRAIRGSTSPTTSSYVPLRDPYTLQRLSHPTKLTHPPSRIGTSGPATLDVAN
ncbi:hypothetical protein ALC62_08044 [Cyphomyrmex costatus]|uniref:Uncharacterized protein n=1 Tax=Cyphomyrmex costatus TaxID=456900 RepID=A0A195CKF3_9HYME|nr:hypothetical protein ALC62_08044 [Cyphomyrmex costatus]